MAQALLLGNPGAPKLGCIQTMYGDSKVKKTTMQLGLAAACALAPLCVAAQTTTTIYGKMDTSIESVKTGPTSATQMNSNASRLGFRGTEDLGGGMKALFGLEMGVNSDNGALGVPAFRNTYVGLSGHWGVVAAGRLDSAAPTRTPLYGMVGRHMEFVVHDAGTTAIGTSVLNVRTRVSNALGYSSPEFGGFVLRAAHYLNGEGRTEAPAGPIRFESDYKQTDISLSYGEGKGPFSGGIVYGRDSKRGGALADDFKDKWIGIVSYDFGPVRTWALAGRDNFVGTATTRGAVDIRLIGGSIEVGGSGKVVANYMTKDVQSDQAAERKRFQIGYIHSLSKRTSLYGLFDRDDRSNRVDNDTIRAAGVGIVHNF